MLRKTTIGALIGLVSVCSSPGAIAQTYDYGVFRVRATYLPESERNCWVQAMVSGQTINADLLTERVTVEEAQCALKQYVRNHLCVRMGTVRTNEQGHGRNSWRPSDAPATDTTPAPDDENIVEPRTGSGRGNGHRNGGNGNGNGNNGNCSNTAGGNGSAGNESAGNESSGNGSAGNGSAGNGSSGNGSAGNGSSGNGSSGHGRRGSRTAQP